MWKAVGFASPTMLLVWTAAGFTSPTTATSTTSMAETLNGTAMAAEIGMKNTAGIPRCPIRTFRRLKAPDTLKLYDFDDGVLLRDGDTYYRTDDLQQ